MKNAFCSATALHGSVALPFVIPSAAEGSAVPRTFPGNDFRQSAGCPILRAFCEGWDTTNLDIDRRLSHPLQRTQRMGHPPIRGASCRAKHQPRLNRELVSSQSFAGVADPRGKKRVSLQVRRNRLALLRQLRCFHLVAYLAHRSQSAQRRSLLPCDDVAHVIACEDDWPVRLDQSLVSRIGARPGPFR
jgi:hypothetical protein